MSNDLPESRPTSIPKTITGQDNLSDVLTRPAYGYLSVIVGLMFAGKSTELLKRILWSRNGRGQAVRVKHKPAFDQRYSEIESLPMKGWPAMRRRSLIGRDKAKPFKPLGRKSCSWTKSNFLKPQISKGILSKLQPNYLRAGVDVVAAGLDMDWRGAPFPISASLSAMADEVVKLRGICSVCGRPSTRSYKNWGWGSGRAGWRRFVQISLHSPLGCL